MIRSPPRFWHSFDIPKVEHGLVDRKGNYDFMFSINTRSRIYFLAVDTRKEMDTWVSMVCKACGLRDTSEEDHQTVHSQPPAPAPIITPPVANNKQSLPVYVNTIPPSSAAPPSAKPSISSPYIHISECFSGKPQPPQPPPRSSESYRHDSSTADDEQVRSHKGCVIPF